MDGRNSTHWKSIVAKYANVKKKQKKTADEKQVSTLLKCPEDAAVRSICLEIVARSHVHVAVTSTAS